MTLFSDRSIQAVEIVQNVLKFQGPFTSEILSGGLSGSAVIKVNASNNTVVVRFWNMQWADYYPQDLACQIIASKAGYSPELFFIDKEKGITVLQYYLPEKLQDVQTNLGALVLLLQEIHEGPPVPKGIDRAIYLDTLFDEARKNPYYADLDLLKAAKDEIFQVIRHKSISIPCHRDLHQGNLIYSGGRFYAIDFTWGAMDDPFTDLANIALFNCKSQQEDELLLRLYFQRTSTPIDMAKLNLMKVPIKLFYGLEFLTLADSNLAMPTSIPYSYLNFGEHGKGRASSADLLTYAISLLTEAAGYIKSEKYRQNLAILKSSG